MTTAREEILGRIRAALPDVPAGERPQDVTVIRDYLRHSDRGREEIIERFADRVRDYHAEVRRVAARDVAGAVTAACAELGLRRIVCAPGLPAEWRPARTEVVDDDDALSAHRLDAIDGAVTGCAVAIAETGTLVLDGQPRSGRRLITLVPDHHICLVAADQIVDLVPEAVTAVGPAVRERRVPITLVSGPSASSDIELSRVEGFHGPRHLFVVIAG